VLLLQVNGVSVLSMNHDEVKALIQNAGDVLELEIERFVSIRHICSTSILSVKSRVFGNSPMAGDIF
jgi:hypothetical protein